MKNSMILLSTHIALVVATVFSSQISHASAESQYDIDQVRARTIEAERDKTDAVIAKRMRQNAEYRRAGTAIADRGYQLAKSGTAAEIEEFRRAHGGDHRLTGAGFWDGLRDRSRALQVPSKNALQRGAARIPVVGAIATGVAAYSALNATQSKAATVDGTSSDSALRADGSVDLKNPTVTNANEEPATFRRSTSQTTR